MTLSRFLRDYIYIPLGGNRNGEFRTYSNLFTVFLVGGLWHGASWMFIIWGAMHGIAIVLHRAWQQMGQKMNTLLAWFITFNFINLTWIFFRAKEWSDAKNVLSGMVGGNGVMLPEKYAGKLLFLQDLGITFGGVFGDIDGKAQTIVYIVLATVITLKLKNAMEMVKDFQPTRLNLLFALVLFFTAMSMMSRVSEFLYFNF
jgi:hypothetical protein